MANFNVSGVVKLTDDFTAKANQIAASTQKMASRFDHLKAKAAGMRNALSGIVTVLAGAFSLAKMKEFLGAAAGEDVASFKYNLLFENMADQLKVGKGELDKTIMELTKKGGFDVEDFQGKVASRLMVSGKIQGYNLLRSMRAITNMAALEGSSPAALADKANQVAKLLTNSRTALMLGRKQGLFSKDDLAPKRWKQLQDMAKNPKNDEFIQDMVLSSLEKKFKGGADKTAKTAARTLALIGRGTEELKSGLGHIINTVAGDFLRSSFDSLYEFGDEMGRVAAEIDKLSTGAEKIAAFKEYFMGASKGAQVMIGVVTALVALIGALLLKSLLVIGLWIGLPLLIVAGIAAAAAAIYVFWDEIPAMAAAAWASVKSYAADAWSAIASGAEAAYSYLSTVFNDISFSSVWESLTSSSQLAWDTVRSGAKSVISYLSSLFGNVDLEGLKSKFQTVWDSVKVGARTAFDLITSSGVPAFESVRSSANTALDAVISKYKEVSDAADAWLTKGVSAQTKADYASLGESLLKAIDDADKRSLEWCTNLGTALWEALKGPFNWVSEKLDSLIKSLTGLNPFSSLPKFDISSMLSALNPFKSKEKTPEPKDGLNTVQRSIGSAADWIANMFGFAGTGKVEVPQFTNILERLNSLQSLSAVPSIAANLPSQLPHEVSRIPAQLPSIAANLPSQLPMIQGAVFPPAANQMPAMPGELKATAEATVTGDISISISDPGNVATTQITSTGTVPLGRGPTTGGSYRSTNPSLTPVHGVRG